MFYLVAVWAAYDSAFRQMGFTAEGQNQFKQKLAVVLRADGRRSVQRLLHSGSWHLGRASGYRDARTADRNRASGATLEMATNKMKPLTTRTI